MGYRNIRYKSEANIQFENIGLFNGSTGNVIYNLILSRHTKKPEYVKIAEEFIDKIYTEVSHLSSTNLEDGLAGIGWGIEYLVQNGFLEGNTDEILDDIDTRIFKLFHEGNLTSFEFTDGLIGYLWYFNARLKSKSANGSMAWRINRELFYLTINRIYEIVTPQFIGITKDISFDLFWKFPMMLHTLNEAFDLNLYNHKIVYMVKQWVLNFEIFHPSININRLFMAIMLMNVHKRIPDFRIEKQVRFLLYCTDIDEILIEFGNEDISLRYGLPGFVLIFDQLLRVIPSDFPNYSKLMNLNLYLRNKLYNLLKTIKPEDFKRHPWGLTEGITGLYLLNIFLNISEESIFKNGSVKN